MVRLFRPPVKYDGFRRLTRACFMQRSLSAHMTHEELITKARDYMKAFDRRSTFGVSSEVFSQARVVETALVYLGRRDRDDYIEVYLNRETGELINAAYHPGTAAA